MNIFPRLTALPLLLMLAATVSAQEDNSGVGIKPQAASRTVSLRLPRLVYATAAGLDLHSTYQGLKTGLWVERNVLGRGLSDQPKLFVLTAVAGDAAVLYATPKIVGKKWARAIFYGVAAYRFTAAARNYRKVK